MKGFTLVEALVAIAIISISISAPLYSASRSIMAAQNARHQIVATHLAQEGVEYVRMLRDNKYLEAYRSASTDPSSDAWTAFKTGATDSIRDCIGNACSLDPVAGVSPHLALCSNNVCGPLYLNESGVYTQSSANSAVRQPYTRTIRATNISTTEVQISSTVSWDFHNIPFSITVIDHLTSWQ